MFASLLVGTQRSDDCCDFSDICVSRCLLQCVTAAAAAAGRLDVLNYSQSDDDDEDDDDDDDDDCRR